MFTTYNYYANVFTTNRILKNSIPAVIHVVQLKHGSLLADHCVEIFLACRRIFLEMK